MSVTSLWGLSWDWKKAWKQHYTRAQPPVLFTEEQWMCACPVHHSWLCRSCSGGEGNNCPEAELWWETFLPPLENAAAEQKNGFWGKSLDVAHVIVRTCRCDWLLGHSLHLGQNRFLTALTSRHSSGLAGAHLSSLPSATNPDAQRMNAQPGPSQQEIKTCLCAKVCGLPLILGALLTLQHKHSIWHQGHTELFRLMTEAGELIFFAWKIWRALSFPSQWLWSDSISDTGEGRGSVPTLLTPHHSSKCTMQKWCSGQLSVWLGRLAGPQHLECFLHPANTKSSVKHCSFSRKVDIKGKTYIYCIASFIMAWKEK